MKSSASELGLGGLECVLNSRKSALSERISTYGIVIVHSFCCFVRGS